MQVRLLPLWKGLCAHGNASGHIIGPIRLKQATWDVYAVHSFGFGFISNWSSSDPYLFNQNWPSPSLYQLDPLSHSSCNCETLCLIGRSPLSLLVRIRRCPFCDAMPFWWCATTDPLPLFKNMLPLWYYSAPFFDGMPFFDAWSLIPFLNLLGCCCLVDAAPLRAKPFCRSSVVHLSLWLRGLLDPVMLFFCYSLGSFECDSTVIVY